MTDEIKDNLREAVEAHFEGTLTDDEAAKLREWLESDPTHMDEFVRQLMVHTSLYEKYAQEKVSDVRPRVVRRATMRRLVPLAAGLVLAFAGLLASRWLPERSGVVANVAGTDPGVVIVRGEQEITARNGAVLIRGDRIRTGTGQTLSLEYRRGKVKAVLGSGTVMDILGPNESSIVLARGTLELDVAKRPMGRPFAVETPQAKVDVLGTAFKVSVSHKATRVDMEEGTARMSHLAGDDASQKVYRWGYGYAKEGMGLLVFPPEGKAEWVKTVRKFRPALPSGRGPGIAYDGSSLWLAAKDAPVLFRVDPNSGRVIGKLDLSGEFRSVGNMTMYGDRLLVNGALHTTDRGSEMCLVDPASGKVAEKLPTPSQLDYISFFRSMTHDGESLWAVLPRGGRIDRLEAATGETRDVKIVRHPEVRGMAYADGAFWTLGNESLYKMRAGDMKIVGYCRNADVHEYCDIAGAGGARLWVADRAGTVMLVDVAEPTDAPR
jgi:ferric-dicitrate binding protein FerR (iron transport regulator)